jgi:segregation and condensation protein B
MTEIHPLASVVEAVLLAAGRPVSVEQMRELFEESQRPPEDEIKLALESLQQSYADRGVELREVASGWRVQIRPQHADVVSRLWQERPSRYSRALLETLALIAYRQPITRSEIEDIRGVTVSTTIMRTLHERNWIRVVGHREVPGRPELLGTTREFLDYFGLKSLDDMPTLAELQDLDDIKVQLELPDAAVRAAEAALAAAAAEEAAVIATDDAAVVAPGVDEAVAAAADADANEATGIDVNADAAADAASDAAAPADEPINPSEADAEGDADLERTPA